MANLNDVVESVVASFVSTGELFTALDVSNKVKESLPFARHREVRGLVRTMFAQSIEPSGYAKTPITVRLTDGTTAEAILYHPLADSWDLDVKYNTQKREQAAARPGMNSAPVVVQSATSTVKVDTDGSIKIDANAVSLPIGVPTGIDPKHVAFCGTHYPGFVTPPGFVKPTVPSSMLPDAPVAATPVTAVVVSPSTTTVPAKKPAPKTSAKDLWDNLFTTPSLFPRS